MISTSAINKDIRLTENKPKINETKPKPTGTKPLMSFEDLRRTLNDSGDNISSSMHPFKLPQSIVSPKNQEMYVRKLSEYDKIR